MIAVGLGGGILSGPNTGHLVRRQERWDPSIDRWGRAFMLIDCDAGSAPYPSWCQHTQPPLEPFTSSCTVRPHFKTRRGGLWFWRAEHPKTLGQAGLTGRFRFGCQGLNTPSRSGLNKKHILSPLVSKSASRFSRNSMQTPSPALSSLHLAKLPLPRPGFVFVFLVFVGFFPSNSKDCVFNEYIHCLGYNFSSPGNALKTSSCFLWSHHLYLAPVFLFHLD